MKLTGNRGLDTRSPPAGTFFLKPDHNQLFLLQNKIAAFIEDWPADCKEVRLVAHGSAKNWLAGVSSLHRPGSCDPTESVGFIS
jgi:hypothetical protein